MKNQDKTRLIKALLAIIIMSLIILCSCSPLPMETLTEPNERDWKVVKVDSVHYWKQNNKTLKIVKIRKAGNDYTVGTRLICPDYLRNTFVHR